MRDDTAGRLLCCVAPLFGVVARICMFTIGYHPVAASAAIACGIAGIFVSGRANRKNPERPVSWIYYIIACLGILIGLFCGLTTGPLFVPFGTF